MRLNVQITPDREYVDKLPGLVVFDILITNDSNYAAKPVNVYAGELRIGSIPELKPGESGTVTRDFTISQAGKFGFTARTVDALNVTQSFASNEVSIAFVPPTAAPTAIQKPTIQPVVTFSPVPLQGGQGTVDQASGALLVAVVVLGVLFGASLLLFLASSIVRARARRQSDLAYDHLEVSDKRDYADPSTYQGEAEAPEQRAAEVIEPKAEQAAADPLPHEKYLNDDAPPEAASATDSVSEEGYQLTRGEDDLAQAEPRTRRAAKHQKPTTEED